MIEFTLEVNSCQPKRLNATKTQTKTAMFLVMRGMEEIEYGEVVGGIFEVFM